MNLLNELDIPFSFKAIVEEVYGISQPGRQGATSQVVFLTASQGEFVCKSANQELYRKWLKMESERLRELNAETNLPVPIFYGYEERPDKSYLLMSRINGVPLRQALAECNTFVEKSKLALEFGKLLRTLHNTNPPKSWDLSRCWLEDQLEAATYNLANYEVDGNQQLLDKLKESKPKPVSQTIIHGDCTIDNVLVSDGIVHSFIDLSGCTYGDPRYDVALAIRAFIQDEVLITAFFTGYGAERMTKDEFAYFEEGLYEFF